MRGDPAHAPDLGRRGEPRRARTGWWPSSSTPAGAPTFPFGTHLAVVEVDTETGKARLIRHVTVDDAGTVVNPVLAEGQRHGGIAQGVAQALLEEMVYDADGNPLTGTLADYAAITAAELPSFELLAERDPDDHQPARGQGHRRGRDDRRHARPCRTRSSTRSATSASATSTCRPRRPGSGPRSATAQDERRGPVKVTVTVNGSQVDGRGA